MNKLTAALLALALASCVEGEVDKTGVAATDQVERSYEGISDQSARMVEYFRSGPSPAVQTERVYVSVDQLQALIDNANATGEAEVAFVLAAFDPISAKQTSEETGYPAEDLVGKITLLTSAGSTSGAGKFGAAGDTPTDIDIGNPSPPHQ